MNLVRKNYILFGFFIFTTIIALGSINKTTPQIDSATFLYIGDKILNNLVPYKDIFDHKPPVIYFINSFALILSNRQLWGIWVIEVLSLCISSGLSFLIIRRIFGTLPAIFATLSWLITFPILIDGGNLTEEYAIPMQFACIYILLMNSQRVGAHMKYILIGTLFALTLLLKQNLIGVFLTTFLLTLFYSLKSKNFKALILIVRDILIGSLFITVPIILYLFYNYAFDDFIEFAFRFNSFYSGKMFSHFFNVLYRGFQLILSLPLLVLALISYFDILVILIYGIKRKYIPQKKYFFSLLLFWLPIEFILVSTSGKIYNHYYLSWMPVMSILNGYLIFLLIYFIKTKKDWIKIFAVVLLFIILSLIFMKSAMVFHNSLKKVMFKNNQSNLFQFIRTNSTENEFVLVWGVGSSINFTTQRNSPTRYIYQTPLYTPGFQSVKLYNELLEDLKNKKPKLVLDGNTIKDKFKPIDCNKSYYSHFNNVNFKPLPEIDSIVQYICKNYKLIGQIDGYSIYQTLR